MPRAQDLVVLREILQRELETINAYEQMIERVQDPTLKQIIEHVTDEEREHVAEMYQLIMARDPKQQERSRRGEEQLGRLGQSGQMGQTDHGQGQGQGHEPPAPRPSAASGTEETAVAAAGLSDPLLMPLSDDPVPPPAPIFPAGSWSVGALKRSAAEPTAETGVTGETAGETTAGGGGS